MNSKSLKSIMQNQAEAIAPGPEIDLWPSIQKRIATRHVVLSKQKEESKTKNFSHMIWKPVLLSILILMGLTFTISMQASAAALELIKIVAGFNVEERSTSPLKTYEEGTMQATEYKIPTLSVSDALANPPFPFSLPAWTPEGYTLDETVAIANSKTWVMLNWNNPNGGEIFMLVEQEHPQYNLPAGEGSSETIQINGQPALLIRGDWASVDQWDPRLAVTIYWEKNGLFYRLGYGENRPIQDMESIIQPLIRIAESIP